MYVEIERRFVKRSLRVIHSRLSASLARLEAHFKADTRCTAMYLWGSLGVGAADAFSDVDVAIVVVDRHYEAVRAELRGLCEALCGPLLVWLPEGEKPLSCNFAFLFADVGKVLLYDCYLSSVTTAHEGPGAAPKAVLFDRAGLFDEQTDARPATAAAAFGLSRDIDTYWIYMYLNGKYFCRQDVYKMLCVQNVLFNTHLKVLLASQGQTQVNWWARDVHALSAEHQNQLLIYFGSSDVHAITRALWQEMDLFATHARAACVRGNLEYPGALEDGVRRHLRDMGVC